MVCMSHSCIATVPAYSGRMKADLIFTAMGFFAASVVSLEPSPQGAIYMAAASGTLLSALLTWRRMYTSEIDLKVGGLNALIAVVAGASIGTIFPHMLVDVTVFNVTNPLPAVGNAFVLGLTASQLIELWADGTIVRWLKQRIQATLTMLGRGET